MRDWIEYAGAWMGLKTLGLLPRPAARFVGARFAAVAYAIRTPLKRAAMFNLQLAFPGWTDAKRKDVIRRMIEQVGWMAGEFSQFPKYVRGGIESIVVLEGSENFEMARLQGKGVLFLTGHMRARTVWPPTAFSGEADQEPPRRSTGQLLPVFVGQPANGEKQIRADDLQSAT
jgi:lauroyl/myristoyl acyltransferase